MSEGGRGVPMPALEAILWRTGRVAGLWLLYVAVVWPAPGAASLSADGLTVTDSANHITWLADGNLAAGNRFTVPLCTGSGPQTCINANGSMTWAAAVAWVAAMNAANYLGHSNWQIPTTPALDKGCSKTGPNGDSFGYGCTASAMGTLYYTTLGLKAPNTAVPITGSTAGPFTNLQPYLYWSQTSQGSSGYSTFSFNTGWVGANTVTHTIFVWPMIAGKLAGTPAASGTGLQINPGGKTVYDPVANVTWLADANLAASNSMGLPPCQDASTPAICVNADGAMNWDSATQFIGNMNAAAGYLGQKNWQIASVDPTCSGFDCTSASNPMGELFYNQFGLSKGMPAVPTPNVATGPLHNVQPYLYWSCQGSTIQSACDSAGPVANQEWSFSFANGFEGTDVLANQMYVMAYFVGSRTAPAGPEITEVANAEGEAPAIAPNTWIEIKGVNLAPVGDIRIWQAADFAGGQLPTSLDKVSVTVNGVPAYVYYISPTQIDVLTAPGAMPEPVAVVVSNNGTSSAAFNVAAQTIAPSFFVFGGGPYVAAQHASNYGLLGPPGLSVPGYSFTPAKPGETVLLYANGFGATSVPVVAGSASQSGSLNPLPQVTVGGVAAQVTFAGLTYAGEFQFNVVIPSGLSNGDQAIEATYNGRSTQGGVLITIHN